MNASQSPQNSHTGHDSGQGGTLAPPTPTGGARAQQFPCGPEQVGFSENWSTSYPIPDQDIQNGKFDKKGTSWNFASIK